MKFLVHPSPGGQTPYIRDDRKWGGGGKQAGLRPSAPTARGPQVVGLNRASAEELRSIQKHVAVNSQTYVVIKLIGVSG